MPSLPLTRTSDDAHEGESPGGIRRGIAAVSQFKVGMTVVVPPLAPTRILTFTGLGSGVSPGPTAVAFSANAFAPEGWIWTLRWTFWDAPA